MAKLGAKRTLDEDAVIYVRTDARSFTQLTTESVLGELWPSHSQFARHETPKQSQTRLFGHKAISPAKPTFCCFRQDGSHRSALRQRRQSQLPNRSSNLPRALGPLEHSGYHPPNVVGGNGAGFDADHYDTHSGNPA